MGRSLVGGLDEDGRFFGGEQGRAGDFWRRFGLLLAAEKKRGTDGQWQREGELPGRKEEETDGRRQASMRSFLQKADGRRSATQGRASGGWRRGGEREGGRGMEGRAGERGEETSTLGGGERRRDVVGDVGQGNGGWQREGREREGWEGWRGRGGDIDAGGGEGGRDTVGDAGEGDGD